MFANNTILSTAYDDYTIKKQIGQGGSSTVFLATSTDGAEVAIKAVTRNSNNKDKIKRFKNEMNFCLKNDHPNIVKIIDYGLYETDKLDCLFYVMPFYDSNLRKEIEKGIDSKKIIDIFMQLLLGIGFAHEKGIWHRDVKPENILYDTTNNIVIIADFGIAHFCEEAIITEVETRPADRLANFMYAAPEQRTKGIPVDGRVDIFALGLILNEMFTKVVISGSKYKKINDVNEEYGFLDKLVDELIGQDKNNRLFPIENIARELSALLNAEKDKAELKNIVDRQIIENTEEDPLFETIKVVNVEYKNNTLYLHLDKKINANWDQILRSGNYSHMSVMGYEPSRFNAQENIIKNCTVYSVSINLYSENSLQNIIEYFKDWISIVSQMYVREEKQKRQIVLNNQIAEREKAIKNKEKEIEINEKLKLINLS